MPQPTQTDVHVDAILTNVSTAYIQNQSRFISTQVFPPVRVDKQSDKYFTFTKNDWFRDEAQLRPDSTESAGSGYNVSTDSYLADVYAMHKDVGDQVLQNSDSPLRPFQDATEFVTQKLLLKQEAQWVTDYFGTSIWDTDITVASKWDDYASSDPLSDIEVGKETILSNTGFLPNTMVMGYQVFRQLKNHPDFVDRIKYTTPGGALVTEGLMASLFGVDRVLVSQSIKATNLENATAAYAFFHGKNVLLAYVNPNPSIMQPSAGYQFVWNQINEGGVGATDITVSRFRIPELKADRVEAQKAWDNKVVGADLGYFLSAAVS